MIEKTTKTWKFEELTDEQQEKALDKYRDINVDYEWWQWTYEGAKEVGLKITSFDLGGRSECNGEFIVYAEDTAERIISDHGEDCKTYKTAQNYLNDRSALVLKYSDGKDMNCVAEDNEYEFYQECDVLDENFLSALLEDYRVLLVHEYEYLTSDEAVKDTLIANEYDFTDEGKIF